MPGGSSLAFLHRPLRQESPAETELWRVTGVGKNFEEVGSLAADTDWSISRLRLDERLLLEGAKNGESALYLAGADGSAQPIKVDQPWVRLPSQGNGLFFEMVEEALPFDQFVDVEAAPEMKPELDPLQQERPFNEGEDQPGGPTHLGLKIAAYDAQSEDLQDLLTIPYNRPSERPEIQLVRRSPDKRFLALVVKFGKDGSPGLWVHDSQTDRLLWTRLVVEGDIIGLDWSSDSVQVALTDSKGIAVLEKALGIESSRLELSSAERLVPRWGAGRKLYLVSDLAIYLLNKDRSKATPVFESHVQGNGFSDLTFDPLGGRVAFTVSTRGYPELVVKDLSTGQELARSAYPGSLKQKAQKTLPYQLGDAIRFALNRR